MMWFCTMLFALGQETSPTFLAIDTSTLPDLKRNAFESHLTGWAGGTRDCTERIYMGDNPAQVEAWFVQMQKQLYKEKWPELQTSEGVPLYGDHALGTDNAIMARYGNIGLLYHGSNATQGIANLASHIHEYPVLYYSQPTLVMDTLPNTDISVYTIEHMTGWNLSFQGGRPYYTATNTYFYTPPTDIILSNVYGQSVHFQYDAGFYKEIIQP